jgi:hypothetical protein
MLIPRKYNIRPSDAKNVPAIANDINKINA